MRNFKPTREYKLTKFSTMNPDIFKELFWNHIEKCARKYYENQKKMYTIESMTINGKVLNDLKPIIANSMYGFVAKLRANLREIANMELYSHELVMDIVDEYLEEENPDMKVSLENIIENYIDDFYNGSYEYNMKLKIVWYEEAEDDDYSDTESESDSETDTDSDDDMILYRNNLTIINLESLFDFVATESIVIG